MPMIEPGSVAPDFALKDQHSQRRKLSDFRGKFVVLYFFPEDDTPLCTAQACQFRDAREQLARAGAVVIGISPQDWASKSRFASAYNLDFTLMGDEPAKDGSPSVCSLYGAWATKNMYGREVIGILRTTYLIDPDGVVVRRWDRVKTPGHAEKVLAELRLCADFGTTGARSGGHTRQAGPRSSPVKDRAKEAPARQGRPKRAGARPS